MILVVDDEVRVLRVIQRALEVMGRESAAAETGEEALDAMRARGEAVDLVLLDLSMPGMGGAETFAALRELHPTLPIVVMSGSPQSLERYASQTHTRCLSKPFRLDALFAVVAAALSG